MIPFDVISSKLSLGETLAGFLMHNTPTIILLIILAISREYELCGAIIYTFLGIIIIGIAVISLLRDNENPLLAVINPISGILLFTGTLFFVSWIYRNKRNKQ